MFADIWEEMQRVGRRIDKQVRRPVILRSPTNRSFAIGNIIFARKGATSSEIEHEKVHIAQQKKVIEPTGIGLTNWIIKYGADKDTRWETEKPAYRTEIIDLSKKGKFINWYHYYNALLNEYNNMATEQQVQEFIKELIILYNNNSSEGIKYNVNLNYIG